MGASVDQLIASFAGLCMLLLFGKFLRVCLPILQKLFLPSSVIGGGVGLILLQLSKLNGGHVADYFAKWWTLGWSDLAGFLINIVFASLFLGVRIPPVKSIWRQSGPQLMYGMFLNWGQWVICLLLTGLFLVPVFGVPKLFATIADVGFAGGHGTAAGLAPTYRQLGWDGGSDVALVAATVGLVISILMGVMFVNIGVMRGWIKKEYVDSAHDTRLSIRAAGIYPQDERPSAGAQTVSKDSIDVLAFHLAVIGMAMLIGWILKHMLIGLENTNEKMEDLGFFAGMPNFSLSMIGGISIQVVSSRFDATRHLIDADLMERLSGTCLDFLITAAVASLDVNALTGDLAPFVIFLVVALAWQVFAFVFLARYLLPNHWFERGLAEFGMATGVIASGLVLLRMVDPESKTPAPADFAYKQLLHSPFMGGGVWTAASLPLVAKAGIWPTLAICVVVFVVWVLLWWFHFRPAYSEPCRCKKCLGDAKRENGEGSLFADPLINSDGSDSELLSAGRHYPPVSSDFVELGGQQ